MTTEPTISGCGIHLAGKFNPAVFQPQWFVHFKLVRSSDARQFLSNSVTEKIEPAQDDQKIAFAFLPNMATFQLSWVSVQVTEDRCIFSTVQPTYFQELRDLVLSTFRLLSHTPINALGINYVYHLATGSEGTERIMNTLAPREVFKDIGGPTSQTKYARRWAVGSSLTHVTNLEIERSVRVQDGIFINVNDHHQFPEVAGGVTSASLAIDCLESNWSAAGERAKIFTTHVLGLGK